MKIVHYIAVCAVLLTAPAIVNAAPIAEIVVQNPAISAVAEQHPEQAQALVEELQALRDAEEDFDGQDGHIVPLSDEDKGTLKHNPFLMEVYEHNPHGMAELLERIRNASN